MFSPEEMAAFFTVIGIDLVLSGDNAIVIGTAAAGLPAEQRHKAITIGIIVAAVTRMAFAMVAFYLLQDHRPAAGRRPAAAVGGLDHVAPGPRREQGPRRGRGGERKRNRPRIAVKSFRSALIAIVVADVSMSLDNILAVTGAAKDHLVILIFGLALSIALMGIAANFIARIMDRYRWITYIGIALITYVAGDMIWRGAHQVADEISLLNGIG